MNRFKGLYYAYIAAPNYDGPVAVVESKDQISRYYNNAGAAYKGMQSKPEGYNTGAGGHLYGRLHVMTYYKS